MPGHQIDPPAGQGLPSVQHPTPIGTHVSESTQHCVPCGQFPPLSQHTNPSSRQKLSTQQTDPCLQAPVPQQVEPSGPQPLTQQVNPSASQQNPRTNQLR